MDIFDFVPPDEMDDLPEDGNLAFTTIVRKARQRLTEKTRDLEGYQEGWAELNEARHGFMNVVVAAARHYAIQPFATMEVPRIKQFSQEDHFQFKADLDFYMTQLLLDNSRRGRSESVQLSANAKEQIRTQLHHLKSQIDKLDWPDSKKAALHKKLEEFEQELNKTRLGLMAVTLLWLNVLTVPGGLAGTGEIAGKLLGKIVETIAEQKVAEDEARRLPPVAPPKALLPPRNEQSDLQYDGGRSRRADLGDDIPF
jgi:hypothetical protein